MKVLSVILILALTGCAGTGARFVPIVDRPSDNYPTDLLECQAHAEKVMSAAQGAMAGAVGGALLGALLGRAMGGDGLSNYGMKVGALSGATSAAAGAETNQRAIISKCLASRGHSVLN